ncbi:MAG: M20 family metallopeptidase [Hyphomicrobiaceae bacterium]
MAIQIPSNAEILTGLREWVEIESQTADVEGVNRAMDAAAACFESIGAKVGRILGKEAGFGDCLLVHAPWGGDGPGILILSHLDTVHPRGTLEKLPWRIEGDRAFGPGTTDMKGGAYLAFAALQSLVREGKQTPLPLRFLLVSDEEVGSPFSRSHIECAGENAKFVLVTEPARKGGNLITARNGTARYTIAARGRAAHSGGAHKSGRSAIKEIAHQVLALESQTDYERQLTFNIGRVHGGTSDNTVPEYCTARLDVRVASMEDFRYADELVRGLTSNDPDVSLTVNGRLNRPPYRKTEGIQKLFDHARSLAREIGFEVKDVATAGGSDGSLVANKVATLDGLGVRGGGAHTLHEFLDISSLRPRLALMRRLMETLQ